MAGGGSNETEGVEKKGHKVSERARGAGGKRGWKKKRAGEGEGEEGGRG